MKLFLVGALLVMLTPMAFAANPASPTQSSVADTTQKNFCTQFLSDSQKYEQAVSIQVANLESRINKESQKIQTDRKDIDDEQQQNSAKASAQRQAIYAKLSAKAMTSVQKQAVTNFKSSMEAAVTARQNAVKVAQNTFRQSFDKLMIDHQNSVNQVLIAFQTAIQAAVEQAKASCALGTRPAAVRQNFMTATESARRARNSSAQQIDGIGSQIQDLAKVRNAQIYQAMQTYQDALHSAIGVLKAAFPDSANGSASTKQPIK